VVQIRGGPDRHRLRAETAQGLNVGGRRPLQGQDADAQAGRHPEAPSPAPVAVPGLEVVDLQARHGVNQAVIAIELWTGVAAEPGVLRSAYAEAVGT
jgi:hypothetical protein